MAKSMEAKLAELLEQTEALKARMVKEEARKQIAAMKAEARRKEAERKADTRRKVILGGLLLAKAEQDERFSRVVEQLVKAVERPADRTAFDGWEPPKPKAPAAASTAEPANGSRGLV